MHIFVKIEFSNKAEGTAKLCLSYEGRFFYGSHIYFKLVYLLSVLSISNVSKIYLRYSRISQPIVRSLFSKTPHGISAIIPIYVTLQPVALTTPFKYSITFLCSLQIYFNTWCIYKPPFVCISANLESRADIGSQNQLHRS